MLGPHREAIVPVPGVEVIFHRFLGQALILYYHELTIRIVQLSSTYIKGGDDDVVDDDDDDDNYNGDDDDDDDDEDDDDDDDDDKVAICTANNE